MKCQIRFLGKDRENIINLSSAEFAVMINKENFCDVLVYTEPVL